MKCLYRVPFSGFFMACAESAEDAKKMSPDDGEVIYSEQSTGWAPADSATGAPSEVGNATTTNVSNETETTAQSAATGVEEADHD